MSETVGNHRSAKSTGTKRKQAAGLSVERLHTTSGVHPYDEVRWERRDVVMTNWRDGTVNFEQRGVEFPDSWSVNATNIVTSKYFRGAVGSTQRESSLRQLIDRVVGVYHKAGIEHGYFATDADADIFADELTWMLLHQVFSFNSPVWFNVGTSSPQQVSACFILSVDDTMESILNWYREEGLIFKGGSGAGLNLSRIRSSKELLSSGGTASGPVSFMRGADASAGTIKSGGATRRAAKMVVLDVDHPDVEEFVQTKAKEEAKIRVLRDAGFDMDRPSCPDDRRGHRAGRREEAAPHHFSGRLGMCRSRHPVRRNNQRLAHLPGVRPHHRVQSLFPRRPASGHRCRPRADRRARRSGGRGSDLRGVHQRPHQH